MQHNTAKISSYVALASPPRHQHLWCFHFYKEVKIDSIENVLSKEYKHIQQPHVVVYKPYYDTLYVHAVLRSQQYVMHTAL